MPMVETLGGALFGAVLQVLFDRLASRQVLDYFHRRKLNEKLLKKLKVKLLSINAVIDDAEQKQFSNSYVKAWLDEVKDAVFDAEDLLDEINYEFSKCELEAESHTNANKVRNFFNASPHSSFDKEIESRVKQVLEDLEFLSSQKDDLGLKSASCVGVGSGSGSKVSQKLPSTSLVVESIIYGRDDDKEMILNWLTSDMDNHSRLSILSIVGMGGMGKTTLAQHVYNDPRMEEAKFGIKAWVCVSDEFDVFHVTRAILEAITKSKDDSGDLETVHGKLKEKLTGRRFLLVLDDVWNEDRYQWKALQTPLKFGAKGSKILVTTRSNNVASAMQTTKIHHLKQLQEDHSWQVFAKHGFQDDDSQLNAELKEIGIKIVEKCKGLPLALETIGCLLHKKSSVSEWENVLLSKIWDLPIKDSKIIPALLLSYYHLPSHLKRCFAYCALFPKDHEFDKESLILLWMAENFLHCSQHSMSPEEVGEQYFDDLLSRSFFQQSSIDDRCFVMHDLLNDLANYVCGDICFRLGVDRAKSIPKMTRHFSFVIDDVQYSDGFRSLYYAERLRTFMPTNRSSIFNFFWDCKMSIHELFSKFKFLRVLSLSWCCDLKEVPDSISGLKHLRSLDLSSTPIKKLPDSTCSLYNLQILKLNYCHNLEELPSTLHKLINLRCLEFMYTKVTKVPMHLGKLKNLQVLSSFYVGKSSEFSIQQLEELNLHGRLTIGELQNIVNPLDALAADLKNKTHLVELELEWFWKRNLEDSMREREVLDNLQPSKHLEKLLIRNYDGTQFPSWLFDNSLSSVVSLSLEDCKYCLCLPPLGFLPFLKHLKIRGLSGIVGIGVDFYGSNSSSFTSLETLAFFDMNEWEEWECKGVTGAFPRLQRLSIVECPKLKGHLPEQLCHLKNLEIRWCKQLVTSSPRALEIRELDLEDCGKLQFEYHPTTLKRFTISGYSMQASSLKMIGHVITSNVNIPMSCCYDFLETLNIHGGCDSLTTFPLDFFPKLCLLCLRWCHNLQTISQGNTHNHLKDLEIRGCPRFESFPREGLPASRLERFSIEGLENLKSLPKRMHILLPSLTNLQIDNCPQVELSDGGLPPNLKVMNLLNCSKLIASLKGALGANLSLETLSIQEVNVESFPDEGLLPLSLTYLDIRRCLDLKKLDYKGLCHLSSLERLFIYGCPNLQCLPDQGLPKSISVLRIEGNCPLVKQRCQKPDGKDWGKISHIKIVQLC